MRQLRTLVSPLVVAALLVVAPVASYAAGDISRIRIGNFGAISDTYYRGEQPVGRDYADLAALGVKTVIDLQADGPLDEMRAVEAAGMQFYRIGMTTHREPSATQLAQFMSIVNDPARQPVYVHCAGGRHRTGVMTAVYRMEHDGWTADRAFQEMKRYGFGMDVLHPEFKRYVYAYTPSGATRAAAAVPATMR